MTEFSPGGSKPGIYIHVPFCRSRCRYCGFPTTDQATPDCIEQTVCGILKETTLAAGKPPAVAGTRFDSIYIGGGTPSILTESQLERLLNGLHQTFHIDPDAEITIEANPGDIRAETVRHWRRTGITRISLGIQALDDDTLRFLGRRHNAADARTAMARVRSEGLPVSADLIFGFPGHQQRDWVKTLQSMLALQPEHLSCYQLTLEPGTPMA
nr:coproporphyrinogen-III oxidase family protein [bacterium]